MITHVSLIGHAEVVAEWQPAPMDRPDGVDVVSLTLGPSIAIHLDPDTAEQVAEALIDALTTRDDVVSAPQGPVPFLPAWVGLA